jgi:hypothetical protein
MQELDSNGKPAEFLKGDRVFVIPNGLEATVICQHLHWDYPESFWGNLELQYDDGVKGTSNSWQVRKIVN